MKKFTSNLSIFILTALALSFFLDVKAATCTSISRSTFGANTVLTSAELNNQFNTVYSAANDLDGGCITDGTIESTGLKASDFNPVYNQVIGGCFVSESSNSQLSISDCSASVNDSIINKTTATVVTMGCTGCSAEAASTAFYVYIKGDSTGSTLNLLILTTAPNLNGYDGSGNKAIARFYNDSSSNIDEYSIDQWSVNKFVPQETGRINLGALTFFSTTTPPTTGSVNFNTHYFTRVGDSIRIEIHFENQGSGTTGVGQYLFNLPSGLEFEETSFYTANTSAFGYPYYSTGLELKTVHTSQVTSTGALVSVYDKNSYRLRLKRVVVGGGAPAFQASWTDNFFGDSAFQLNVSVSLNGSFTIPIKNWQY